MNSPLEHSATISSDAHHPDELHELLPNAKALLTDIGFREILYFEGKERKFQKIA
ncbi:MAG: hypothetical protein R2750_10750 [Bacteroidales bacterium]